MSDDARTYENYEQRGRELAEARARSKLPDSLSGLYWDPRGIHGHYVLSVEAGPQRIAVRRLPIGRAPVAGEDEPFCVNAPVLDMWVRLK